MTDSRSDCSKSECIASTLYFFRFKENANSFTFCFEEEKTIVFVPAGSLKSQSTIPIF